MADGWLLNKKNTASLNCVGPCYEFEWLKVGCPQSVLEKLQILVRTHSHISCVSTNTCCSSIRHLIPLFSGSKHVDCIKLLLIPHNQWIGWKILTRNYGLSQLKVIQYWAVQLSCKMFPSTNPLSWVSPRLAPLFAASPYQKPPSPWRQVAGPPGLLHSAPRSQDLPKAAKVFTGEI